MATKRRTAAWYWRDGDFIVRPANWDKGILMIFSTKADMLAWARDSRVMLKEVRRP